MMNPSPRIAGALLAVVAFFSEPRGARCAEADPPALRALIVGGGPNEASNAAQIESHARFVLQTLPTTCLRRVLFADGKPKNTSVTHADLRDNALARRALAVLLPNNHLDPDNLNRVPDLGVRINGASRREEIHRAVTDLLPRAGHEGIPLLLYFAGHGSQGGDQEDRSEYDLWSSGKLTVRQLSSEIARLPRGVPIVLVMAQCYSGGFADAIFHNGNPKGEVIAQDLVGFFSARRDRLASGCGWETGEEDYQDFSSYFFAAITGHNRFGKPVGGADFDGNGSVSLHEALCFALIHDESADTPNCTSDVFLKRFVSLPGAEISGVPYAEVLQAATAAQRAVLETISRKLDLDGEARALAAYDRLMFSDPIANLATLTRDREAKDQLNTLRRTTLTSLFERWPALRWDGSKDYAAALEGASQELAKNGDLCRELIKMDKEAEVTESAVSDQEAWLIRFTSLCESIVRAKHLKEHGKEAVKARFNQLWEAEQRSLPLTSVSLKP